MSGNSEDGMARLRTFTRDAWGRTLDWLHISGLALVFWHRLEECQSESVAPPEVRARLVRNLTDNQVRVTGMLAEFDSINHRLKDAGVPFAVLKGFALIPEYFPDAALRSATDYDYLLPKDSLGPTDQALRAAGYIPLAEAKKSHSTVYANRASPSRLISCLDDMYSPQLAREIELHSEFWKQDRERIYLTLPDDPLACASLRSWQGLQFPALCDEDALIFHLLHFLRHVLGSWCRLSSLFEIAYFLNHQGSNAAFWERFRRRVQGHGRLPQVIGVAFTLAADVFGAPIPVAVAEWTTQALPSGMALWVQRYGKSLALQNFSGNKFSLFLHREFVQDIEGWRHIRRRRVFLLERPSQVAKASGPRVSSRLKATWRQLIYVLGLLSFHLPATLSYWFELPRWKRMLRRVQRSKGHFREGGINPTVTN
jgi:hypothetical protein